MGRIEKTVFISYRRTNTPWALAIYQYLTSQGYDVFFDYISIPSGDFENIIVENIRGRAHFIVILTPSALERCHEPGDWLRREIETAMEEKRNIVPLMLESFDYGTPAIVKALTGKLESLKKYNSLRIPSEYFFEAMTRLREQFLSVALDAVAQPISDNAKQIAEEHQVIASEAKQVEQEELNAQEWFERGFVFEEAKNYDEAIRCYTTAIRLQPEFAFAYNNRAVVYNEMNNPDAAIKDCVEAIRITPGFSNPYLVWGNARKAKGDVDGAIKHYTVAIRLQPEYADAYNNRGIAHRANNDLSGALADYDEAIRLKPDDAGIYNNRGAARSANNDLTGALADYDEAIRLKPDDAGIYNNRGGSQSQQRSERCIGRL